MQKIVYLLVFLIFFAAICKQNAVAQPTIIDRSIELKPGLVERATFSPDGARIVTIGGIARIWDANTGRELRTMVADRPETDGFQNPSRETVYSAVFSSDGKKLLLHIHADRKPRDFARIVDAESGRELRTLARSCLH